MPLRDSIASVLWLTPPGEPGEAMLMEGTVLMADERTPAADVVLYIHHTNTEGLYIPAPGQQHGRRHGRLRGWARTGADGRFSLHSIRPAPYPGENAPAHIHIFVEEPGKNVYYIDEVRFLDDPLLTAPLRASREGRGGDLDIHLLRDEQGTWRGHLRIVLGRNIPHYR
ncbi:MAG: hypothetical protein KIT10_14020 [Flavobacteriales bacterium]|nr:hypothetical protein [Flavobacteriales bacterium]